MPLSCGSLAFFALKREILTFFRSFGNHSSHQTLHISNVHSGREIPHSKCDGMGNVWYGMGFRDGILVNCPGPKSVSFDLQPYMNSIPLPRPKDLGHFLSC